MRLSCFNSYQHFILSLMNNRFDPLDDEAEDDDKGGDDYYKVGMDSKYDVWQPPTGQTGDGRTSLNEKLGY